MGKSEPEQTETDERGLIMMKGKEFLGAKRNLKPFQQPGPVISARCGLSVKPDS